MLCKRFILRKCFFSVEKFGRLGVLDEYVELCDLCLRFVFWAVNVNFFRCASGGKFFC